MATQQPARNARARSAVRLAGPQEVAALVDSGAYPYLDVRTPEEFEAGHVGEAVNGARAYALANAPARMRVF
jgi:rhodanese-related sulfurtransferase